MALNRYSVGLSGTESMIQAESFRQDGDFVSFYVNKTVVALIRIGHGDWMRQEGVVGAETP